MSIPQSQSARPTSRPTTPYRNDPTEPLYLEGAWIWAPLNKEWLRAKPEEVVRQEFVYRLHSQWGYPLEQMQQEARTMHGRGSPRADIIIADSIEAMAQNRDHRIVIEVKAEHVPIAADDYAQGESYARAMQAEFLVLHNQKETRFFRLIPGAPGERVEIVGIPKASELNDARRLEEIRKTTKTFTRDEFQRLLLECHNILRDNHKMDPGAAFDEISKILFIKMASERMGRSEVFTTDRLREIAQVNLLEADDPAILGRLFDVTRRYYQGDKLFGETETLKISLATFKRIVGLLERFNLSDTGEDIKGIAFEKFLGQTFRGELGQFFTPRPIVEFMVAMLDPQEGEAVCDPAAGTGGFLIKVFEHLRTRVEHDVQVGKAAARAQLEAEMGASGMESPEFVARLDEVQAVFNAELDVSKTGSRLHRIAHDSIFGVDAEARAARTAKMNMIMHGDGHGGIHYHDGLLDTNGVFAERFDVVITNPPFGSTVGNDQIVGTTEQTRVETDPYVLRANFDRYGAPWADAHAAMEAAANARRPILELFDIGRDPIGAPVGAAAVRNARSTETLFVERCLRLLRPGGRLGIVLPDGVLNNPTLSWLREYVEGRARLLAVVSIPHEVFASAKATVKTSLVFLRKFDETDQRAWDEARRRADDRLSAELQSEVDALTDRWARAFVAGREDLLDEGLELVRLINDNADKKAFAAQRRLITAHLSADDRQAVKRLQSEAAAAERALATRKAAAVWQRTREYFDYPVFMAQVDHAGITGTGETGPAVSNQLPQVLELYRHFTEDPDDFAASVAAQVEAEAEKEKKQLEQAAGELLDR
jgi:type I restriction enzyme M protein